MNDEAISRTAVLDLIETCNSDGLKGIFCSYDDGKRFESYVKELPPVTPQESTRPKGTWKHQPGGGKLDIFCFNCDFWKPVTDSRQYNFCPNCGADMRGDNNEND